MTNSVVSAFAGKTVLITGGAGYVGSSIVAALSSLPCRIIRLDRPGAVFTQTAMGQAQVTDFEADIRYAEMWHSALQGVDFVFHLAGQTSAYFADQNPRLDADLNALSMLGLLEACRSLKKAPVVVFSSTATLAGLARHLPVDETHPDEPLTMYELHKLAAENYLSFYSRRGLVGGVSLRLANVYGPGPKSGSADRGILNLMMRRALAGETLTVYGAGDQMRDYVYVEDVAQAFLLAAACHERTRGEKYLIGSGVGHTIAEAMSLVAERAAVKTGRRVELKHMPPPPQQSPIEARNFVADTSKFSKATGWKALVGLAEGIDRTLQGW